MGADRLDRSRLAAARMLGGVGVDGEAVTLRVAEVGVLVREQLPVKGPAGSIRTDIGMGWTVVLGKNDTTPGAGRLSAHGPTVER